MARQKTTRPSFFAIPRDVLLAEAYKIYMSNDAKLEVWNLIEAISNDKTGISSLFDRINNAACDRMEENRIRQAEYREQRNAKNINNRAMGNDRGNGNDNDMGGKEVPEDKSKQCKEQIEHDTKAPARKSRITAIDPTDENFLLWWSEYPRKEGKSQAFLAWEKAYKIRPKINEMLSTLEWQKKSHAWTKDGGQFIPMPATYINQGRWADERPPAAKTWEQKQIDSYNEMHDRYYPKDPQNVLCIE